MTQIHYFKFKKGVCLTTQTMYLCITFSKAGYGISNNNHLIAYRHFGQETENKTVEIETSCREYNSAGHQEDGGRPCWIHLMKKMLKEKKQFVRF